MSTRGAGGGVWARLAALEHEIRTLRLRVSSEAGGGVPAAPHASTHYDGDDDEVDVTQLGGFPGGSPKTYLDSDGAFTNPGGNSFTRIAVSGQSDVVADQAEDTLTLVAGSNVTLTTNAGSDSVTIAAGGGGGGSTTTDVYASRPAAGNDGDLFFPSDGLAIDRDNGSTWQPWGPIYPFTAPVDGDFAWINQGSASVSAAKGAIYLSTPADAAATNNLRIRKKAAPATPYTITAAILPRMLNVATHLVGLCFRQSSDGKVITHTLESHTHWAIHKWTNASTYNSTYTPTAADVYRGLIFLRIADDGANRICSVSMDGINFFQIHSVGRTDFLTADEVGFFVSSANTTWGLGVTLLSWKEA